MNLSRQLGLASLVAIACPFAALAQVSPPPAPIQQGTTTIISESRPAAMPAPVANTIGSHQIDRFEAIRQLQADLGSDANNVANWTILGELAHEVALDLPQGQDDAYYTLSRQAYERASQLDPNNPGLRSAVQFAREQEANAPAFDARRRQGVSTYLDARRREMAATGVNPTVMVYESTPTFAPPAMNPNQPNVVGQPQPYAASYPTATYRPYYNPQARQPLSYNQYSNGYAPPVANPNQPVAPTTLRQFGQQLPGMILNQGVRNLGQPTGIPR